MNLKFKPLIREPQYREPVTLGTAGDGPASPASDTSRNVTVSYGIHRGTYPIGGMRIRDARLVLRRLINIDDSAVAVINAAPVDEEQTIGAAVTMLSFVKPSAMKGARAW